MENGNKMNEKAFLSRMKKYAEKNYPGVTLIKWTYKSLNEDVYKHGENNQKILLTQIFRSNQNGNIFELKTPVLVPYDGRKSVEHLNA